MHLLLTMMNMLLILMSERKNPVIFSLSVSHFLTGNQALVSIRKLYKSMVKYGYVNQEDYLVDDN